MTLETVRTYGRSHGTYSHYTNRGCRCRLCRAAARLYGRAVRERRKTMAVPSTVTHGLLGTYTNWNCRCEPCRAAKAAYDREYRAHEADEYTWD